MDSPCAREQDGALVAGKGTHARRESPGEAVLPPSRTRPPGAPRLLGNDPTGEARPSLAIRVRYIVIGRLMDDEGRASGYSRGTRGRKE